MERKLTADQANDLRFDDEVDGIKVVARRDDGIGRWMSYHSAVLVLSDVPGYWAFNYDLGLTECQEHEDFTTDAPLYEVFPREVTTVVYEAKR